LKRLQIIIILGFIYTWSYCQIIADHNVVDKFDDIPEYYLNEIKKMWLTVPGESHSYAYRYGLTALETLYPAYSVSVVESGTPQPYTESNLRASRATWGDLNNSTGWIYSYGEEDWFTSITAIDRTKAGITYCNTHSLTIGAMGFGWCWDPGILDMTDYLNATQEYINYCSLNSYPTKIFFTTGTVDSYTGETGYYKHLAYESIRNYAKANNSRILFDYADILCYDEGSETPNTTVWEGHTYPIITQTNLGDGSIGHISSEGAIRLAKAIWWMLARIAGWDGQTGYIWEGDINTNFGEASNWVNGIVPPNGSDISFSANPVNHCILDQNRSLNNITNAQTISRFVLNGRQITVTGILNFSNGAQIDASAAGSELILSGTTTQFISPGIFTDNTLPILTINNQSGVTLNNNLVVTQTLSINSNSSLSVSPGNFLNVSGNIYNNAGLSGLILQSNPDGNGTLINETVSVPATVELDLTGGLATTGYRFHYFVPPVLSNFIGTDSISVKANLGLQHFNGDLVAYNETLAESEQTDGWKYYDGYPSGTTAPEPFNELISTRGYNIYLTDNDKITFKGILNSAAHTFSLNYTSANASPGWNLIGNPFPCSYDLQGITELSTDEDDGIDNTVYFTKDGDYLYWNVFTDLGIGWNSDIVPSMQGFFVRVNNSTTLTLPIISKVTTANISRAKGEVDIESETTGIIRLELSNSTSKDQTMICLNGNATSGFDKVYDSYKLFGNNTSKSFINSELNSIKYAINSLKEPDATPLVIPLKLTIQSRGSYKIDITQFDNLDNFRIVLKHGLIETNLQNNSSYSFNSEEGSFSDFWLIINRITADINKFSEDKIKTWYHSNILSLNFSDYNLNDTGNLIIYDLNGKMVFKGEIQILNGNIIQIPLDLKTGIYLISISATYDIINSKLIVY